jgi:lactoylglutathione lyase
VQNRDSHMIGEDAELLPANLKGIFWLEGVGVFRQCHRQRFRASPLQAWQIENPAYYGPATMGKLSQTRKVSGMTDKFTADVQQAAMHTAIRVADLDKALYFYSELIGLPIRRTRGPEDNPNSVWLPGIQLLPDPEVKDGTKLDHAAIGLNNIEEVCKRLDEAGFVADTPLNEVQPDGRGGRHMKMAFYHDPEGNKVELLNYLDE